MAAPSEFDTRQTVVNRVDPFIEAAGTAFTGRLTPLLNPANAVNTGAFAQKVQGQNKLQQQALQQAATQGGLGTLQFSGPGGTVSGISGTGVAGFQPFLKDATTAATQLQAQGVAGQNVGAANLRAAAGLTGPGAGTAYMSPFQQQVIDATRASYQNQRAQGRQSIMDSAVAAGAYGGGREGVQRGVYDAQTTLGATQLEADLRAQNFAQAQVAAQQGFQNQGTLASALQNQAAQNQGLTQQSLTAQSGLAQLQPQLASQNISSLSSLGSGQQALGQAQLDVTAANAREAAYEEQQRLGFFGSQFAPFTGGFGAASQFTTNTTPPPSTLNTILGVGTMAGGLLGGIGSLMG